MGLRSSRANNQPHKDLKSLAYNATGKPRPKRSVQKFPAKYWGTWTAPGEKRKVIRSDGSVSTDKTGGFHSRPGHKQEIRNANRSITKSARQTLKRQMMEDGDPLQ